MHFHIVKVYKDKEFKDVKNFFVNTELTTVVKNIEPPYPDIAKLTVMDDTIKRKLLSSKRNDSHIFKFPG
jgi:hypothetical protein